MHECVYVCARMYESVCLPVCLSGLPVGLCLREQARACDANDYVWVHLHYSGARAAYQA
jgi:hypothetical protein